MKNTIKACPAKDVWHHISIEGDISPDLIISFGHTIPQDAALMVRPLPDVGETLTREYWPYHMMLGEHGSNSMMRQPKIFLQAIAADVRLERDLGMPPQILVHCSHGQSRSVTLGFVLEGARLMRAAPECEIEDIIAEIRQNRIGSKPGEADKFENNFGIFMRKPLIAYRETLQPHRPQSSAIQTPSRQQAQRP